MSGRASHELKLKKIALRGLEGYPLVLRNYYDEAAGSQRTTKSVFANQVKRFVNWLSDEKSYDVSDNGIWAQISVRDIKDYFKSIKEKTMPDGTVKELKAKTLYDVRIALDNFFVYLIQEGYANKNPVPDKKSLNGIITGEMQEHVVTYMTPEEVKTVCAEIEKSGSKRDLCIFKLGCRTGLRAEALSEIDITDLALEDGKMRVIEKNKKFRTILLAPDLVQIIRDCINERSGYGKIDNDALFVSTKKPHGRITKCQIAKLVEKHCMCLGRRIKPHDMRRTCGTNTYNATGDIFAVAKILGHSNIQNTKRYIDASKGEIDAVQKLANLY